MPANVRYIVDKVDAAVTFYRERLGFDVEMHYAAGFAILSCGDLVVGRGGKQILLEDPAGNLVELFESAR